MAKDGLTEGLADAVACFDDAGTPLTTPEVADRLGVGRRSAYDRLDRLVDHGHLETKKAGANARVWWQPRGSTASTGSKVSADGWTLDRYESVFETVGDAIYVLDAELHLVMVNDAAVELTGYSRDALLGEHIAEIVGKDTVERALRYDATIARGDREIADVEFVLDREDDQIPVEARFTRRETDDGSVERVGVAREITTRKQREHRLRRYETIFETIDDGVYTVDAGGRFTMVNDAYTAMTGYAEEDLLGEDVSTVVAPDTAETASAYEEELVAGERDSVRFEANLYTADGDRFPAEATFAILPRGDEFERVGVVRDVSERVERERKLERQRERLEALNTLNTVFRDVTEAVIDQSTRAEIESTVCETLAASDSYHLAWIGDLSVGQDSVAIKTEAGVDTDCTAFQLASVPATGRPPTFVDDAVTDQVVATTTIASAADHDPWLEAVSDHAINSGAALPITSNHSLYGILTVYSTRETAFDEDEQAVLDQLGEVVGHAITAVDRKQALTSDHAVELEFEIRDVFDGIDLTPPPDTVIEFDDPLRVTEDSFIEYCTASKNAMEVVDAMVDSEDVPNWESYTIVDEEGDRTTFELHLESSPVFETVADHGGYVREARIEDSDLYMRLQFNPTTDVRRVVDTIQDANPSLDFVTQRHVSRDAESVYLTADNPLYDLTNRQRSALEAAYQRGYFTWPRDADGETVADALEIAPATFHQHLRRAQQQLFTDLFDTDTADG